ncbi:hypothetical protein BKA64DRAFT_684708 [Cadophora sp. MPI-SDFR-AT-0126]|nr:hypothetical protein BKA64DRAFT_684708 [Leotiomycetes sp. MPI-SDFR-AT-0126]
MTSFAFVASCLCYAVALQSHASANAAKGVVHHVKRLREWRSTLVGYRLHEHYKFSISEEQIIIGAVTTAAKTKYYCLSSRTSQHSKHRSKRSLFDRAQDIPLLTRPSGSGHCLREAPQIWLQKGISIARP